LPSIGFQEIIIILVLLLAIFFFARLKRQSTPPKQTNEAAVVTGDNAPKGSPKRWITLGLVLLLLGLLGYYFFFVYPQP
jgi:hypothetical protein